MWGQVRKGMTMKTDVLNVRLEPELAQALARHKEETGVPTGEFVRRTLRKALLGPAPIETRDNDVAANLRRAGFLLTPRSQEEVR